MSRAGHLLELVQALRRRRGPVTAAVLAAELGVSVRTVYRDVAALAAEGAPIEGEAGIGYVLRPGFVLPPLMLRDEEVEAIVLGLRMVARRGDPALVRAAADALAKVAAVLPDDLRALVEGSGLFVAGAKDVVEVVDLGLLRRALREERKLAIGYADEAGRRTERTIWPMALAFFERTRVMVGWCELRKDVRTFRCDRITTAALLAERLPRRRAALLKQWRAREGIPEPA